MLGRARGEERVFRGALDGVRKQRHGVKILRAYSFIRRGKEQWQATSAVRVASNRNCYLETDHASHFMHTSIASCHNAHSLPADRLERRGNSHHAAIRNSRAQANARLRKHAQTPHC